MSFIRAEMCYIPLDAVYRLSFADIARLRDAYHLAQGRCSSPAHRYIRDLLYSIVERNVQLICDLAKPTINLVVEILDSVSQTYRRQKTHLHSDTASVRLPVPVEDARFAHFPASSFLFPRSLALGRWVLLSFALPII